MSEKVPNRIPKKPKRKYYRKHEKPKPFSRNGKPPYKNNFAYGGNKKGGNHGLCPVCLSEDWSPKLRYCGKCDRFIPTPDYGPQKTRTHPYDPNGPKLKYGSPIPGAKRLRLDQNTVYAPDPSTAKLPDFEEHELIASICKESFFEFVKEFWPVISQEQPVWNWHIKYLCGVLQEVAERVFKGLPKDKDIICNISPGTTKSTLFSVMLPAWCWTRMPSCRIIGASYAYNLAMDLSRKCRDIIISEKYRKCFPYIKIREDQNSKGYFVLTSGGDRYAVGVNGSVMGMHGHIIIVDDPLDPQQALSDADVANANYWMSETLPSRKVDKRITPMLLVMQRLHQNDPTGNRLDKVKAQPVIHICLPAELSDKVYPPELAKHYVDGFMDPIRLNRRVLDDAFAELGEYGYAGQHMQNPIPRGGGMFKIDRIHIEDIPPTKFKQVVRGWDKAGTGSIIGKKNKAAWTVGTKIGLDLEGRFWILDVIRGQWDSDAREKVILNTAKQDGVSVMIGVEQEPGSGGKESAENTVKRLVGFVVKVDKVGQSEGNKAQRADPFSTQVNGGNVYMVKAPWNQAYLSELEYFPMSKFKDQVDSSALSFNMVHKSRLRVGAL